MDWAQAKLPMSPAEHLLIKTTPSIRKKNGKILYFEWFQEEKADILFFHKNNGNQLSIIVATHVIQVT